MNQSTIKIKPASGVTVRDPETRRPLSAKGATKPKNSYWMRRLRDGDVLEIPAVSKKSNGGSKS